MRLLRKPVFENLAAFPFIFMSLEKIKKEPRTGIEPEQKMWSRGRITTMVTLSQSGYGESMARSDWPRARARVQPRPFRVQPRAFVPQNGELQKSMSPTIN